METRKYVFTRQEDDIQMAHNQQPVKFYQICGFPHPQKQKYEIRVVHFDSYDNVAKFDIYNVTKQMKKKLQSSLRDNLYKIYATFTLDGTSLPTLNDISIARSRMICDDSSYYGYAAV